MPDFSEPSQNNGKLLTAIPIFLNFSTTLQFKQPYVRNDTNTILY